jgi:mRNA interferase MazF
VVVAVPGWGVPVCARVPVTFRQKNGLILLDQIRTVDKMRLVRKEGIVEDETLRETLGTLQDVFAE